MSPAQVLGAALSGLLWGWAYFVLLVAVVHVLVPRTWMPVHSKAEPVHLGTMTCAGIPCEELYESGVDLTEPWASSAVPWSAPAWWDTVWFRELAAVASISDDELEAEAMGYAIARMRGVA